MSRRFAGVLQTGDPAQWARLFADTSYEELFPRRFGAAMGLAASQSRYLMLTARKNDLELTGQQINQSRMQLANMTNDLFNTATTLDPDAPEAIKLQMRINAIQSLDKSLELQLRRVDTQQEAVRTEIEAVKKVIDKNVDLTFKTFA
ncbi:MAG: hypothetical protein IPK79_06365 [Vampirovibrionales bacterium]|nr:hypothetical protein [Vampirovibrionales bacterium]